MRAGAAGAGAAVLIACGGGGGDSGLKLDDTGSSRQPGTVWLAKNDWRLADETKQAVRGGIYRDFLTADLPSHLDPIPQPGSAVPTARSTYQLLMARNRGPGIEPGSEAYNNPVGALAESWEIAADGLTVTFTMRPNVRFHDLAPVNGRVMDIDDWKTSHERHITTGTYRTVLGEILSSVQYPDARHMVWKLNGPYAPLVDRIWDSTFAYYILPRELNANPLLAEQRAIGTGHKILDRHEASVTVEFKKHPQYWGGDPFIDRWHQPVIPEPANQRSQFIQGNITAFTPQARDVMLLRRDAPGTVIIAQAISETQVCYQRWGKNNTASMPWKDERVRIAVRRSIDYASIAQFLSNKAEFEANGIPVEISTMTHVMHNPAFWLDPEKDELGALSQNYFYNIAEAKKLTAAAGFTGPIDLPWYVNVTGDLPNESQVVIDSLKAAGTFNVDIRSVPANEYRTSINIDGRYDGTQLQTCAAGNEIDYHLFRDFHNGRPGGVAFPDPKMDQLAEAQRREIDFEKRVALIKDLQLYQAQKFYIVPGRDLYTTFSFRWPWLHNGNYAENLGASPDLGGHLHWLDKDMPNRDRPI
jgi:peptide/nickel transport system substrate-binding protein